MTRYVVDEDGARIYAQPTQADIRASIEAVSSFYGKFSLQDCALAFEDPRHLEESESEEVRLAVEGADTSNQKIVALAAVYAVQPEQVLPVVVQGNDIIDGHHRVRAAIRAGLKKIWTVHV